MVGWPTYPVVVAMCFMLFVGSAHAQSPAAAAPDNSRLTGEQIRAMVTGNSVRGIFEGKEYTEFYLESGTIIGTWKGKRYRGNWHIDGDQICYYQGTPDYHCETVEKNGDRLNFYDDKGLVRIKDARLLPGNPAGL